MTSKRKIAANRRNSRKSCGPRSAAGKFIASRNALRHGLAAVTNIGLELSPEIDHFAKALVGDDDDPLLFEQARVIAMNNLVLQSICTQRIAVVERLRDPKPIALVKGNNSLALGKDIARRMKNPAFDEIDSLFQKAAMSLSETEEEVADWTVHLEAASELIKERDEYEAMEEAAPDLLRLERYHRRTWSLQKRAIRKFMNIKLMRAYENAQATKSNGA